MRKLAYTAVAAGIALAGAFGAGRLPADTADSAAAAEAMSAGIAVSGDGRVTAVPDMARISVGVVTQGATAAEAMGKNGEALTKVIAKVKELGVPATDIQSTGVNLYPQYGQPSKESPAPPPLTGYRADTSVQITVNDIGKAVWVLDGAVQAGATQANGIQFGIKNTEALRIEALKLAAQGARSRADAIASGLGLKVLGVRSASDGGSSLPMPVGRGGAADAGGAPAAPVFAPVPVEGGQLTVNERVSVIYDVAP
ncbi:MAG: SIMPL domain-containing protein [Chloroflexi bacterium]|nr:SIMPL domain-containing protein [Chloroflexota bacterium]